MDSDKANEQSKFQDNAEHKIDSFVDRMIKSVLEEFPEDFPRLANIIKLRKELIMVEQIRAILAYAKLNSYSFFFIAKDIQQKFSTKIKPKDLSKLENMEIQRKGVEDIFVYLIRWYRYKINENNDDDKE